MKNAKYLIWQETHLNGPQSTSLTRVAVVLTVVLLEEATATIPTATRVVVTAALRLTVTTAFPLGPYFM